jgi:hypothetical protein
MHPHDEVPSPVSLAIARLSLLRGIALCVATFVMAAIAIWLWRQAMAPIALATIPASSTTEQPSAPSPFAVTFPEMLILVTHTPEATPEPTPTYTMLPTPRPPAVCLTSTPRGTVCTQPLPPLPSPSPMADCPVVPGELCVSGGGPVRWLTPTPTAEASMSSGLNS